MPKSSKSSAEIPWPKILREAQQRFRIKRFRPGQREVLEQVFRGNDTLALMPTGAGKSLTYQLPALFLPKPVVVVSPLIALMQDQQQKAREADVAVERLDSTLRKSEVAQAEREIAEQEAQLIYVTPERLQSAEFIDELKAAGGISLLVVDEAHTIAQWGHDFRPAFLAIGEARRALGDPPVLALTATATPEVAKEILASLHAEDATIVSTGTERTNLSFAVHPTVNHQAKLARIGEMLEAEKGSGILYTASVRSADDLFAYLTERGHSVGHYHGRMPARQREAVQQAFMRGDHRIMIATKAFGLGIDKPDIRFVYHFEFPDSLETYYQEAGRAGRDGLPAHAALLYRLEDKRIQSFFLAGRYPHLHELRAVYGASTSEPSSADALAQGSSVNKRRTQVIVHLLIEAGFVKRVKGGYLRTEKAASDEALEQLLQSYVDRGQKDKERLAEMMHYAETPNCRTQVIRAYFSEPEGEPCLRCDNCVLQYPDQVGSGVLEQICSDSKPNEPLPAPQVAVTTVQTAYGEIHTTAPETLPTAAPAGRFRKGDNVRHKRFGQGKILDLHNDIALIDFIKSGQKRLRQDFLLPA